MNDIKGTDSLRGSFFDTWKVYMQWYTWFFGANLFVLGWVYTKPEIWEIHAARIRVLSGAWIFFNILGLVTAILLGRYTQSIIVHTEKSLSQGEPSSVSETQLLFPRSIGVFGGYATAATIAVNILMWAYVFLEVGKG